MLVGVAGCSIPLTHVSLEPVPGAGAGSAPVKAQVRRVGITNDLLAAGAKLGDGSRIAVEVDVFNADPRRPVSVQLLPLAIRDALGGGEVAGRPVNWGDAGLPSGIDRLDSDQHPPRFVLRPGETRTVWVAYAGFPADGPERTVRAAVQIEAEGQRLEIPIADPVPGGPRWKLARRVLGIYVGGALSALDVGAHTANGDRLLSPLGLDLLGSRGRLVFGVGTRFEYLYRESLIASGPPAIGVTWLATVGWVPWRFPVGVYGEAGGFAGSEFPPQAYARLDGSSGRDLWLPCVGAGLLFWAGPRLASTGPLPIERPLSPLRRFMVRIGYAQWFNLGDTAGAGGLQMALSAAIAP